MAAHGNYDAGKVGGTRDIRNWDNLATALNDPNFDTFQIDGTLVTSTGAELNLLDGSAASNAAASVAVIMDPNKAVRTAANVGTAGTGCVAVEYGDGHNHVTELTLTTVSLTPALASSGAEGIGAIIYTFPAGAYAGVSAHIDLTALVAVGFSNAAEIGLDSVIASGNVSDLGTPATFEDWSVGATAIADVSSPISDSAFSSSPAFVAAGSHVLNLNMAGTWTAASDTIEATGIITFAWKYLGV